MKDKMNFDIENLVFCRAEVMKCKTAMEYLINAVKQSSNYIDLETRMDRAQLKANQLEIDIRAAAIFCYNTSGDKSPHPAVGIRVMHKLNYEESAARQWCMTNMPTALKLDKTIFEKHAKAVSDTIPLLFVTFTDEPQATIASDLSKYFPDLG